MDRVPGDLDLWRTSLSSAAVLLWPNLGLGADKPRHPREALAYSRGIVGALDSAGSSLHDVWTDVWTAVEGERSGNPGP